MKIDPALQTHLTRGFGGLNTEAAVHAFPAPSSLPAALEKIMPAGTGASLSAHATPTLARMFLTASVNIWLRAIHSFLVSAALTHDSPPWASVAGYYSSHYSIRAIAHCLGYFQLFGARRVAQLEYKTSTYICTFRKKNAGDREHRVYWRLVKEDPHFAGDALFTANLSGDISDVSHRDFANYVDHLAGFPTFRPLSSEAVKNRIDRISEMEMKTPPIPRRDRYPDIDSVQIVAYHRLLRYRDLLDTVLGNSNRFWGVYRDPAWARGYMHYQVTEEPNLRAFTLT